MSSSSTSSTGPGRGAPTTSTSGSMRRSGEPVRRAAVITHGKARTIGPAIARLENVAREAGVELLLDEEEAAKHGLEGTEYGADDVDVALVLGGDGTILRAQQRFLGTDVPVVGVNFGRVGFLTTIQRDELEEGVARVFAGDYVVVELPTLELELNGGRSSAVNDVVATSATVGRMIELGWAIGGEDLGVQPCDGLDLRDAVRLDRVQPLERRPGARLGARGDGADVRRAALALRAAARRPAGARPDRLEPHARRAGERARRRPRGRASSRRPAAASCGSPGSGRCSARCRRRRSSRATARSSGTDPPRTTAPSRAGLCPFRRMGRIRCGVYHRLTCSGGCGSRTWS